MVALRELAPDAYLTTDVGQHQMWAAQFLPTGPRRWISSAGLGTMGYGMPAAMGVQVAFPQAQVICVAGDASILMNIQELGTLSQYQLPVKVVVLNNGWQGMVRQWQQAFHGERYSCSNMEVGMPNFELLAQAYGIKGMVVHERGDLADAVAAMLAHDGPVLMDVHVRRDENCYPMVAPGKGNHQMLGLPEVNNITHGQVLYCASCGHENTASSNFCAQCGTKL
jgi:acetolactate synthase-1/2/3 large subunit